MGRPAAPGARAHRRARPRTCATSAHPSNAPSRWLPSTSSGRTPPPWWSSPTACRLFASPGRERPNHRRAEAVAGRLPGRNRKPTRCRSPHRPREEPCITTTSSHLPDCGMSSTRRRRAEPPARAMRVRTRGGVVCAAARPPVHRPSVPTAVGSRRRWRRIADLADSAAGPGAPISADRPRQHTPSRTSITASSAIARCARPAGRRRGRCRRTADRAQRGPAH
jgi:hypothetical protein